MAFPSIAEFLYGAQAAYSSDPASTSPLALLTDAYGAAVEATRPRDGFHGIASITDSGEVIVSFEGTELGSLDSRPTFVNAQIEADQQIFHGENPALYGDALRFTRRVIATAERQGISRGDIYVNGHSLGGAEAEFVAARTGLAGETFGAPGIASSDIAPGASSGLVNFVDDGDPIGNYGNDPNRLGHVLQNPDIEHFGAPFYIGQTSDRRALARAGQLFGATPLGTAASLAILGNAAEDHHLLADYAKEFGVALPSAGSTPDFDASDLAGALAQILGDGGRAPLQTASTEPGTDRISAATDLSSAVPGAFHRHG